MFDVVVVNNKFIEKELHEGRNIFTENLGDDTLECGRRCIQPEHHDNCHKCCLFMVLEVHSDLIISTRRIQKVVPFVASHCIQYAVYKRKRKYVGNGLCIQFPIIDTHLNFCHEWVDQDMDK